MSYSSRIERVLKCIGMRVRRKVDKPQKWATVGKGEGNWIDKCCVAWWLRRRKIIMSAQPKRDAFWFYLAVFIGRSIRLLAQWEQLIDWCCFYYFVRNSLVALLEALCARKRLSSSGKYDEWQVTSSLGVFAKCSQIMSCHTCLVIIGAGAELKINWAMEGISFWVRVRCHAF